MQCLSGHLDTRSRSLLCRRDGRATGNLSGPVDLETGANGSYLLRMPTSEPQLYVNEIYASIQGESSHTGLPCVFVRLTGCNLRCSYCDTEYAFYEGDRVPLTDVLHKVRAFGLGLVEITGGEPLLQPDCVTLAQRLLAEGYTVLIETSGERPIDVLPDGVIRIMDIKCPSSGECGRMNWDNIRHLNGRDEVKFVIGDRADYEWAREVMREHDLASKSAVLMSVVHDRLTPRTLCEWILADRLPVRFQLQAHKYIWGALVRGV